MRVSGLVIAACLLIDFGPGARARVASAVARGLGAGLVRRLAKVLGVNLRLTSTSPTSGSALRPSAEAVDWAARRGAPRPRGQRERGSRF